MTLALDNQGLPRSLNYIYYISCAVFLRWLVQFAFRFSQVACLKAVDVIRFMQKPGIRADYLTFCA